MSLKPRKLCIWFALFAAFFLAVSATAAAERAIIGSIEVSPESPLLAVNSSGSGGASPGDVYSGGNGSIRQLSSSGDLTRVFGVNVVSAGPDNSNETQAVMVKASGGTFTLVFGKKTTEPLAFNAPVNSVAEALEKLSSIGHGSVSVAGGPGDAEGSSPYLITLEGALGGIDQPLIGVDGSGLTGVGTAASAYAIVSGGGGYEICEPSLGDVCGRSESSTKQYQASWGLSSAFAIDQASGLLYLAADGKVSVLTAGGRFVRAFGPDVVAAGPDDSSVNEQQEIMISATGGAFTLSYGDEAGTDQTTAGIPFDASAGAVESALNGLSSIAGASTGGVVTPGGGGRVTVTGGPSGPGDPGPWSYTVTFHGYLGGDDVLQLGSSGVGLQGPGHVAAVSTTLDGGASSELCRPDDACNLRGKPPSGSDQVDSLIHDIAIVPSGAPNQGNLLMAGFGDVREFTPNGEFIRAFGWDVDATDPSTGFEVCTASSGHVCQPGTVGPGVGQINDATSIAADSAGDIYTAEGTKFSFASVPPLRVQKFTPQAGAPGLSPSVFGTDETQAVTVNAGTGQFRLGVVEGEGTVGTATVTKGSPLTLSNVTTSKGAFVPGQRLSSSTNGVKFSPDTEIAAVGPGTITLSKPVEITVGVTSMTVDLSSDRLYTTGDLAHDIPPSGGVGPTASLENAINALPPITVGGNSVSVSGGVGDPTGSSPYSVVFDGVPTTDPPQLVGVAGTTPLGGGTGTGANEVAIVTTTPGGPGGSSAEDSPTEVEVGADDHLLVLKRYPAGATVCANGLSSLREVRIQEFSSAGAVVDTSAPCTGITPVVLSGFLNVGPNLTANTATGRPYVHAAGCCGVPENLLIFGPPSPSPTLVVSPGISNVSSGGGTISGTINPNGPGPGLPRSSTTTYRVEYKKHTASAWAKYIEDAPVGAGTTAVPFSVGVTGLAPATEYDLRVVVTKLSGTLEETRTFTTLPDAPSVGGLFSDHVTAFSADLHAKVNPQGADTTYHFEYGKTTAYGLSAPIPDEDIGSGSDPVSVSAHIDGLEDITYHFRIIAHSNLGTAISDDQSFSFHSPSCPNQAVRQQTSAAYLPDCRAYELVSPENAGGVILYTGGPQSPYATNPPRLAFTGLLGEIPGAGPSPINVAGDLYVATRGDSGWHTRYIGPSSSEAGCVGGRPIVSGAGFAPTIQNDVMADPGLDRILDWNLGNPNECLWGAVGGAVRAVDFNTAARGSNAPYVWNANGGFLDRWPTAVADVPGSVADFDCPQDPNLHPYPKYIIGIVAVPYFCSTFVTTSKDLNHFVFSSQSGLFGEGGLSSAPGSAYDNDTSSNTLKLISVLPGTGGMIPQEQPFNGGPRELIQFPSVSSDGSHILMGTAVNTQCRQAEFPPGTASEQRSSCPIVNQPTHLYMRVNDAVTYDVSAGEAVHYISTTPDGTKVYFTSPDRLTADDTDHSVDLYMWDENGGSSQLTLISSGTDGTGNEDNCISSWTTDCDVETYDDSTISTAQSNRGGLGSWFPDSPNPGYTDNAVAAKSGDIYFYSPEQLDHGRGVPGKVNLYTYHDGHLQHVAALEDEPYCLPSIVNLAPNSVACSDGGLGRLQVTPNGRYAAFVTTSRLTTYDNRGFAEMYRYDADTRSLICVSCNPDESPPTSAVLGSQGGRFITDDGRVFFDTEDSLDPRDTNQAEDVYEFVEGRPQLITSGTGTNVTGGGLSALGVPGLYGVSADGIDVYFSTVDTLVGQDHNGQQLKFYDARTNGGFRFVPPPAPCQAADECHGPSSGPPGSIAKGTGAALGSGGNFQSKAKKTRKHHKTHKRNKKAKGRHHRPARHGSRGA